MAHSMVGSMHVMTILVMALAFTATHAAHTDPDSAESLAGDLSEAAFAGARVNIDDTVTLSVLAALDKHCARDDVHTVARCLYAMRALRLPARHYTDRSGCVDPANYTRRAECVLSSMPSNAMEWDDMLERDRAVCATFDLDHETRCEYACDGARSVSMCKHRYAYSAAARFIIDAASRADAAREMRRTVRVDDMYKVAEIKLMSAITRHIVLLTASAFTMLMFVREVPSWVKFIFFTISFLLYLSKLMFLQAAITIAFALVILSGTAVNVNNVVIASIGTLISFSLIAVDAVNSVQFSTVVGVIILTFVLSLFYGIFVKRFTIDTATLLFLISTGLNIVSGLRTIIVVRQDRDPFVVLITWALGAAFPYTGTLSEFVFTQARMAHNVAVRVINIYDLDPDYWITIFFFFYVAAYFMFIGTRVILGMQVTHRLQGISLWEKAWRGFLFVWTDFYSFIEIIPALMWQRSHRTLAMYMCICVLKCAEMFYAWDLFVISCIVAFLMFVFDFKPTKAARVLANSGELMGYPAHGSEPHFDGALLNRLGACVGRLTAIVDGIPQTGVGILFRNANGVVIATVKHVAELRPTNFKSTLYDLVFPADTAKHLNVTGDGDDPVSFIKIQDTADIDVPELEALTEEQSKLTKALIMLHPSGMLNYIKSFSFDHKMGYIGIGVNLTHGDSGSPLIAVLENGTMYLAGFISRGIKDGMVANIATSICALTRDHDRMDRLSPGILDEDVRHAETHDLTSREVVNVNAANFDDFVAKVGAINQAITVNNRTKTDTKKAGTRKRAREAVIAAAPHLTTATVELMNRAIDNGRIIKFNVERGMLGVHFTSGGTETAGSSAVEIIPPKLRAAGDRAGLGAK